MALPASMDYSPKLGGSHARRSDITIKSNSTNSYTAGSTIYFDIPVRPNSFLDQSQTYLSLNLSPGATATELDHSVYSAIKSLTIVHGSNQIEYINNYGVLASALNDMTTSEDGHKSSLQVLMGCEADRKGYSFSASTSLSMSFPILSGLFSHCQKYIPLGAMNDVLQLQFLVASDIECFKGGGSITISNPELHATYIELSSEAYNSVKSANGGQWQFYGKTWKHNQFTPSAPSAGNTNSFSVPARLRSLTDYIITMRRSSDNVTTAYTTSGRVMGGLKNLQVRVGDQVYPQKPIDCEHTSTTQLATAYAETLKSFGSLYWGDFCTNVNLKGFYENNGRASVTTNKDAGTVLAVNVERYSGRNHVLQSGLDTTGSNSQIDFTWGNTSGNLINDTVIIDIWCECDVLFSIDEMGQLSSTV